MSKKQSLISRRQMLKTTGAAVLGLGAFNILGSRAATPSASTSGTLTVLAAGDLLAYFEYLKGEFKKDFPNVNVQLQTVGYDQLYTRASSVLASGSDAVDIIEMDCIWTADFAKNGWAVPLNEYLSEGEKSQLRQGILDPLSSGGNILGLPVALFFKVMFYNTQLLKKLGLPAPPTTYESLAEIGAKAKAAKQVKYVQGWGWSQAEGLVCDWTEALFAFGGKWFKDGKWAFNDEAGVAALTYMVDNLKSKVFDPASVTYNDRTVMNPFFVSNYLAMLSWGLWGWNMSNDPKESKIVGDVDVGLIYGTERAGVKSATCSGGGGHTVNPKSKNRELAVEWIKRAVGINHRENQTYMLAKTGNLPTLAAIWDDPKTVDINPAIPKMAEQSKYTVDRPGSHVVGYQGWSKILQVELSSALTFQKSPKDALDAAVGRSNAEYQPFGL
ncbi:MAG: multiple sugar transport system substrate-binding protein [Verrucomicrobiota bacterium]|jgi:multiple sugar transport system substrate-binding protein|nr:multiple sugar transport system substrate-binding protein [Verrucomicrobiota bacterium]